MDEQERVKAFLGRGYLPKELPPPFQSNSLAENAATLSIKFSNLYAGLPRKQKDLHPHPSHPVLFDMARKGHSRRTLSIPNPINQFYLVEEIAKHWPMIKAKIDQSPFSLTKCDLETEGRAIGMPPLSLLAEKRIIAYAAQGAILQTDLLSFYHSIYTHAVPWAIHGKAVAKANRKSRDSTMYGNRLDYLLRSCQDGQTIGIPVGPDTSRVISELMGCAIEERLLTNSSTNISDGFRYVDDIFFSFDSFSDAESTLAVLREACNHFDLQLNATKTSTRAATDFNESTWAGSLAAKTISSSVKGQRRSLLQFFSEVIELTKALPDESIASFAVRKTARTNIFIDNWDVYLAFLLRIGQEHSNCLDSIVKIICTYVAAGYPISQNITTFIERIIKDHAPYNHHFEISWALWLAYSLNIRLSANASNLVLRIENSVCAILTLHLRQRRLLTGRRTEASWLGNVTSPDLMGNHWLLIYEGALRNSWRVAGAKSAVEGNLFFNAMREEGVSFYNTRAYNKPINIPRIQSALERQLKGRQNAVLPGNVFIERQSSLSDSRYEELGADYDDENDFSSLFIDDDDDIPI